MWMYEWKKWKRKERQKKEKNVETFQRESFQFNLSTSWYDKAVQIWKRSSETLTSLAFLRDARSFVVSCNEWGEKIGKKNERNSFLLGSEAHVKPRSNFPCVCVGWKWGRNNETQLQGNEKILSSLSFFSFCQWEMLARVEKSTILLWSRVVSL